MRLVFHPFDCIKGFCLSGIFVLLFNTGFSQAASTEAKAAYLLAEEAYNANDWTAAKSYLAECTKKLGKPNSKILYLQIMTEMELGKSNAGYYDTVAKSIAAFEELPDIQEFNEEKALEIMKIKLKLNGLREVGRANDKGAIEAPIASSFVDSVFGSFTIRPGQSESTFDRGRLKKFDDKKGTVFYFNSKRQIGPAMVNVKNGIIHSVTYLVKVDSDPSTLKSQFEAIMKSFPVQLSKNYVINTKTEQIESCSVVSGKKLVSAAFNIPAQEISIQLFDVSYIN